MVNNPLFSITKVFAKKSLKWYCISTSERGRETVIFQPNQKGDVHSHLELVPYPNKRAESPWFFPALAKTKLLLLTEHTQGCSHHLPEKMVKNEGLVLSICYSKWDSRVSKMCRGQSWCTGNKGVWALCLFLNQTKLYKSLSSPVQGLPQ